MVVMQRNSAPFPSPFSIKITAIEEKKLELGNLAAFLYDIGLIHDRLLLILSDEYYYQQHLSAFFYRRIGRPIRKPDRLQVKLISKKSPFVIELLVTAATVIGLSWTFVKIFEKLADWNEDRKIKRLQREDLELGIELKKLQIKEILEKYTSSKISKKHVTEAEEIEDRVVRDIMRLEANEQLKIDTVETSDEEQDKSKM